MISKGWHCCWSHYWSSMAGVTYSQVSQSYGSLGHREKCLFMLVVWHLDIHKNPLLRLDLVKERRQLVDKLMCVEDHRLSLSTNWCVWKIINFVFRKFIVIPFSSKKTSKTLRWCCKTMWMHVSNLLILATSTYDVFHYLIDVESKNMGILTSHQTCSWWPMKTFGYLTHPYTCSYNSYIASLILDVIFDV